MEDSEIVELFFNRNQTAISFTSAKYANYLTTVGYNILKNREDTEEILNDTLTNAWNSIPPNRPSSLKAYLSSICRNLALNRYNAGKAAKRNNGNVDLALDELAEIVGYDPANENDDSMEIQKTLNNFLSGLKEKQRNIFVSRYYHLKSVEEIAADYGLSETNVKQILFRTRNKLKDQLIKAGVAL